MVVRANAGLEASASRERSNGVGGNGIGALRRWWVTLYTIAGAMQAINVAFLVIGLVVVRAGGSRAGFTGLLGEGERATYEVIRYVLLGLSVLVVGLAFWLRRFLKDRQVPSIRGTVLPDTPEGRAMLRFFSAARASLAAAEAPAAFGLVIFLLLGGFAYLAAFVVISVAAGLLLWPRRSELRELTARESE